MPPSPLIFYKFLIFFYTCFPNLLTIQVKFNENAEYVILYSEMELLQPFGSVVENCEIKTI